MLNAVIGQPNGAPATGVVSFFNGTSLLGSAPVLNGAASFSTKELPVAINHLSAVYSGDAGYASSVSAVVDDTMTTAHADVSFSMFY